MLGAGGNGASFGAPTYAAGGYNGGGNGGGRGGYGLVIYGGGGGGGGFYGGGGGGGFDIGIASAGGGGGGGSNLVPAGFSAGLDEADAPHIGLRYEDAVAPVVGVTEVGNCPSWAWMSP